MVFAQSPFGLFYKDKISEFIPVAEIGEIIFRNIFTGFQFIDTRGRELVKIPRLTNQVQRDVGKRYILFKYGSMARPLTVPVTKNQCIICLVDNII